MYYHKNVKKIQKMVKKIINKLFYDKEKPSEIY